jgi:signal peptide peptidase SppA
VVLVSGLFFSSPISDKNEIQIEKQNIGKVLPVAGALPGVKATAHVAIIKVSGEIGGELLGPATSRNTLLYLVTALALAEEDPDLSSVVIYISSPGGDAAASGKMYRNLKAASERLAKRKIPVIAYVSSGAYSGGYYTALGATMIVADPEATVGNIGVIMHMFNTAGLGDMFGIKENIIATGPNKSTGSQWEHLTSGQEQMVRQSLKSPFGHFLLALSESRNIPLATVVAEATSTSPDAVSNGGWFSAEDALSKKLIDKIVPEEFLFPILANSVDKTKYKEVEFEDYQKKLGITESMKMGIQQSIHFIGGEFKSAVREQSIEIRAE